MIIGFAVLSGCVALPWFPLAPHLSGAIRGMCSSHLENSFWASLIGFPCLPTFLFNCSGKEVFCILRVESHSLKESPGSLSVANSWVVFYGEDFFTSKYSLNLQCGTDSFRPNLKKRGNAQRKYNDYF